MCKVSSGSVQWDCKQFPHSKSGEVGREQEGPCALIILEAHSAPHCFQSLTAQGMDPVIPGGTYQPIQFCDCVILQGQRDSHTC